MIEPNDALNKLVFGTSGITDAEAMHELDLIAQGRASDDRKARKLALESNQHTDDFLSGDYQTNVKKWNEMVMRGTMSQDMAKAIIQNWRERKIFASGSVEKQLTSLSPESRAEFIRRIGKGMSAEDWNSMVYSYTAQGLISPAVAGDLINNPVQSSAVSKVAKAAGLVALGLGAAALLKGRGVGKVAEVLGREGGELAGKAAPKGLGPTERMGGAPGAAFRHEVFPMNEWDKLPESFKNEVRQAAEKGDKPVDTELPAVIRRDIEKIVVDNNPFIYHENPKDHEDITLAILKATTPVMMEDAKRMPDFAKHVLETTTAAFRDKKALTFVDLRTAIEQVLIGGNIAGVRFPYSDMAKVLDMEEKGIIQAGGQVGPSRPSGATSWASRGYVPEAKALGGVGPIGYPRAF